MTESRASKHSHTDKEKSKSHPFRQIYKGFKGHALARLHPEGGFVHVFVEKHLGYKDDTDRRHHVRVVEDHPEEGRREYIRPVEEVFHHPLFSPEMSSETRNI